MLILNNVKVFAQNFGSVIGIFLVGDNPEAIEQRYYSFFNHEATNGNLEWWTEKCALFWVYSSGGLSAEDKVLCALAHGALAEILNTEDRTGTNPWPDACYIANERYNLIEWVTWFKTAAALEIYDVGHSVAAEKGTGNFDDDVLGGVVERHGAARLLATPAKQESEAETEEMAV